MNHMKLLATIDKADVSATGARIMLGLANGKKTVKKLLKEVDLSYSRGYLSMQVLLDKGMIRRSLGITS